MWRGNLWASPYAADFDQIVSLRQQQDKLLRDVLNRGLSVAIGTEHGYEPLASCAVVVAPLQVEGHDAGAVGLLGPTRMNYPQALAAAHVVGERLGERMGSLGVGETRTGQRGTPTKRGGTGGRP